MKKILDSLLVNLAPVLAQWIIRFLSLTMRKTYVNYEAYRSMTDSGKQTISVFWHGRLLMVPYAYPGRRLTGLISQSKDGELIRRVFKGFGIESVRGSTTRGSLGGIRGLLKSVREGRDLALTPDGPKGPGMKAQMGAIHIARATGLPVFPISFNASKKKIFGSWDSFLLPYPFSKGVFICGDPLYVKADAGSAEMEEARQKLENSLNELTAKADSFF
ncbi:MAG: lysophospholipid acyltransferase family protein [Deltaproteobacteria bacterium]|nr:lysophospholipid acyltransferase family protein [Deltaproteobacteria bacterium]